MTEARAHLGIHQDHGQNVGAFTLDDNTFERLLAVDFHFDSELVLVWIEGCDGLVWKVACWWRRVVTLGS